jgi:hypothetical protein
MSSGRNITGISAYPVSIPAMISLLGKRPDQVKVCIEKMVGR